MSQKALKIARVSYSPEVADGMIANDKADIVVVGVRTLASIVCRHENLQLVLNLFASSVQMTTGLALGSVEVVVDQTPDEVQAILEAYEPEE